MRPHRESAIEQIRIVISDLSPLVADLLDQAIAREPDMVVVGRCGTTDDSHALRSQLLELDPDVVVVGASSGVIEASSWLSGLARLTVFGIDATDGAAERYTLCPHRVELGPISPAELVVAIRASGQAAGGS